ncbi:MAG: AraC family transcriptional regulator [Marinibacterium sp.]|nr:AraC family transcriptional regulator [Marinibacterium sp.]
MPDRYGPNIVSSALSDLVRVIHSRGGDTAELYHRVGFQGEQSTETLCLRRYVQFSEMAADLLAHPEFGWEVGTKFDLRNMGRLGHFILQAPTLGAALTLMSRAFAMVQSDSVLDLSLSGDEATLTYRILDLNIWPRQQDVELTLSVLYGLLARVAGPDWRPLCITFEHAPSPIWQNPVMGPRCRVEYLAAENSIRFPARLLDQPMQQQKTQQFLSISTALSNESRRMERAAPVTIQVRREILKRFGQSKVDQTEIAGTLGLSRRTLRRRLEDENHSFSKILSDCRVKRAEHMLALRNIPIAAIADYLGYADVTPFERAFRAATGLTPAKFRSGLPAVAPGIAGDLSGADHRWA